ALKREKTPLPISRCALCAPRLRRAVRPAVDASAMSIGDRLRAVDRAQQRPPATALVGAVIKRIGADEAGQLGALIAYDGVWSLCRMLRVVVTALGFVLQGNPSAQESVLHSTLSQFPIIGSQLQHNVHSLKGSGVALAIGLVASVFAGLGITNATQRAFNQVW